VRPNCWDLPGNAWRLNPRSVPLLTPTITSSYNSQINNEKFAALAGFGNPRSATNAWASIKKKLGFVNSAKKETTTTAAKSGDDDEDENDDGQTTPTPKKRKAPAKATDGSAKKPRARKGKNVKVDTDDDEDAADVGALEDGAAKQEGAEDDAMKE